MNYARHKSQAMKFQKRLWLTATAGTTLYKGQALCYNRDYGTATERDGERDSRVELPSTTNNLRFAGVLDHNVTVPSNGEIKVTINEPGSVCDLWIGSDTVVDSTYLWALAGDGGKGIFRSDVGACLGRGAALALQTNASGVLVESIDGTAVVNGTAVAKTGLFAGAAAGDKLVIMASATAAGAAGATPGVYTLASVTDDDNAVLTASASSGASEFAGFVQSANPQTCLALLLDGEESGLVEWINVLDNAASAAMVAGATHVLGGVTLGTGDCTDTLADGTFTGEKKLIALHGALTTQDYLVTVTSGIQMDGSTALATVEFDADGDYALLEWVVSNWQLISYAGPTLA